MCVCVCVLVHVALESSSDIATRNETMGGGDLFCEIKDNPLRSERTWGGGGGGGGGIRVLFAVSSL